MQFHEHCTGFDEAIARIIQSITWRSVIAAAQRSVSLPPVTGKSDNPTAKSDAKATAGRPGSRAGLFYGLGAYSLWGIFPLYFHVLSEVPPWVVLCHRIVWSSLLLAVVISLRGEWKAIWPILRSRRQVLFLTGGSVLLALNWLIFIYAVGSHQVLETSLGYFINPLLSVALGVVFLRERLRAWQWVAVLIALIAVANLALRGSVFPWIAVSLACTFGFYGLVRKKLDINSLHGLMVETTLLLPMAVAVLAFVPARAIPNATLGLLSLSGFITAVPMLMFGAALRRLKLSTIGFLQYISPTLNLLVAVAIFHEPLDRVKLASFALCWLGIAVYTADSILTRHPQAVANEPE
jgi:chloramphenicol-sensitive protein RarD